MASSLHGNMSRPLQSRDLDILRSLLESRVMTQAHISALHFENRSEAAKKRLQKLKAAKLIKERPRKTCDPAVLSITRDGIQALAEEGILNQYPALSLDALVRRVDVKESTVTHELAVLDTKVAFHDALRDRAPYWLQEFSTWSLLFQFLATPYGFERREQTVKPDGFIRIREQGPDGEKTESAFFLEVDLSTENHETLVKKAACYMEYYRAGGFAVWCGGTRDDYKKYPFRILMIVKTEERRNTLAEQLVHHTPPIRTLVYLSTRSEVEADPLGPIWIMPGEYLKAVTGSPYEKPRVLRFGQAHQIDRDEFVKTRLRGVRLLDEP